MMIVIPFKVPTINHVYLQRGFHKFITKEGKEFRSNVEKCIASSNTKFTDIKELMDKKLSVTIKVHEDWYTKKGDIKQKDIDNRAKFLLDSIFPVIGINDKNIFKLVLEKIQNEVEGAEVEITAYD